MRLSTSERPVSAKKEFMSPLDQVFWSMQIYNLQHQALLSGHYTSDSYLLEEKGQSDRRLLSPRSLGR